MSIENEKLNEQAEQPQEQKTEFETQMEDVVKEKLEKLSLDLTHKATTLVNNPDLSVEVIKLIDEAINGAFDLGRAAGMKKEDLQKITDTAKEIISQFLSPVFVEKVEKYKQLYSCQRMITSHLTSALRHAEVIGNIHESSGDLMGCQKEENGSTSLGTTLAGLGTLFIPMFEKAVKD